MKITPDGQVSDFITGVTVGNGLAVDTHDHLYAVSGAEVLQFTPDGQVRTFATLGATATAVAVAPDGQIYAVDRSNTLSRLHADGTVTPLPTLGLNQPLALTIDAFGQFYVLNTNDHILRISPDGQRTIDYFSAARFEYEGVNVVADCADNLLFAPLVLPPIKTGGEEDYVVQLVGATGEVREVLYGPALDPPMYDMDVLFYDRFNQRLLIWSDLGNGLIFALPVTCGGLDVTVHLVTRPDVELLSADPAPQHVTSRDDGTQEAVWMLSQVDTSGQAIQLNLQAQALQEGEERPVFQDAFLVLSNSFDPEAAVQVPIPIPVLLATSAMDLTVQVDQPYYGPEAPVQITTLVTSQRATPFDGQVTLAIVDAADFPVATLPAPTGTALAGFATLTLTDAWQTGATLAGDYRVQAQLLDADGHAVAIHDRPFTIGATAAPTPGTSVLTATVTTAHATYAAWDTLDLTARVRNTSLNTLQAATAVTVRVQRPDGSLLFQDTRPLGELLPGTLRDLRMTVPLVDQASGVYTVSLTVTETTNATVLATADTTFTVDRQPTQGLTATVTVSQAQVSPGDPLVCTATLTNHAAAALAAFQLTQLLLDLESGAVLMASSQGQTLAGGTTLTTTTTIETAALAPGAYGCVLQVQVGGVTGDLGAAGFAVVVPPIRLEAALTLRAYGRLLVLLDAPASPDCAGDDTACATAPEDEDEDADAEDIDEGRDTGSSAPHGPRAAPSLAAQRAVLADVLQRAGWTATLVTDAEAFTRAFRSGGYSAYVLLAEQVKLPEQVQDELCEAVFRGDGLLVAGTHDQRNGRLDVPLGIASAGHASHLIRLRLEPSVLTADRLQVADLQFPAHVRTTTLDTATAVGFFERQGTRNALPAATVHTYGSGRSVSLGFDLLAEAASPGAAAVFTDLLLHALADVHPTGRLPLPGAVVPVQLTVTNAGLATPGQAVLTLPDTVTLVDAGAATRTPGGVVWAFDLLAAETATLTLWVQLPRQPGLVELAVRLEAGQDAARHEVATAQVALDVVQPPSWPHAVADLEALAAQDKAYRQARDTLDKAVQALAANDPEKALHQLVKTTEKLIALATFEANTVRYAVTEALRQAAQTWWEVMNP